MENVKTMVRLSDSQVNDKINFINGYKSNMNAANSSLCDPNANVVSKNIATLQCELWKDMNIQLNRRLMYYKIGDLFGYKLAEEYLDQLENHEIYKQDESSLMPYCVSVTLYPYLLDGTTKLGGSSNAPKHFNTFCGSFLNLVYEIASQFAGAVATGEWLLYMDYFATKDFGADYTVTHRNEIESGFASAVYGLNEPCAARNFQSVFWNISIFDKPYFEALFSDFAFPDGTKTNYNSVHKLQVMFMRWFNKEREVKLLTFPVITQASLYTEEGLPIDVDFQDFIAGEMEAGNSFFNYQSDSADSLSSCCRVKNNISNKPEFSYSLGAGGIATGSISVMTLNFNRLQQDPNRDLETEIKKLHKYQVAFREIMKDNMNAGLLPVYTSGFINMDRQYSTIGIIGLNEAAEFMGIEVSNNQEYIDFCKGKLKIIYDLNREAAKKYGFMMNCEAIPGESVGVKFAKWDKEDGYIVNRDCYNSYFYLPDAQSTTIIDKLSLHGSEITEFLDGGCAAHLNMDDFHTKQDYKDLLNYAAKVKCFYWCINVPSTCCNDCGYIGKKNLDHCIKCGSKDVDYAVRIIGYLKRIKDFSKDRQKEAATRVYL